MQDLLGAAVPDRLGVAVSGGGDSVALMLLLHGWAQPQGVALHVATVDHGLRPAAAQEAAFVARLATDLRLPCAVLRWTHAEPDEGPDNARAADGQTAAVRGNLQGAARDARYGLLAGWARDLGLIHVAVGHTQDDQAETFLMRLARGSGVDGLSCMAGARQARGVTWLRPLLDMSRAELRGVLTARGIGWVEDPSNEDTRFDRVRARHALAALSPLGLDAAGLAQTAARMARARAALSQAAFAAAEGALRLDRGDVLLDRAALLALPDDLRDRLLAHALCVVGNTPYRPRLAALHRLCDRLAAGQGDTLHGTRILCGPQVRITREWQAVRAVVAGPGQRWDGRWDVVPPAGAAAWEVRALGPAGLALCPGGPATGLPRASLVSSPAIWRDARLVAAPLAGFGENWRIFTCESETDVRARLLSH